VAFFPDLADVAPTFAFFAPGSQCGATYRERRDVARLCANVRPFGPAMAFFSSAMRGFSRSLQPWPRTGGGKGNRARFIFGRRVLASRARMRIKVIICCRRF
jgi:hypothetical protein